MGACAAPVHTRQYTHAEIVSLRESAAQVVCGVAAFSNFGVEHGCNETRAALFRDALAQTGLYFVAQVHTCGYPISSADVDDHLRSSTARRASFFPLFFLLNFSLESFARGAKKKTSLSFSLESCR